MSLSSATARALPRHRRPDTGNSAGRITRSGASREVCLPYSAGRVARCAADASCRTRNRFDVGSCRRASLATRSADPSMRFIAVENRPRQVRGQGDWFFLSAGPACPRDSRRHPAMAAVVRRVRSLGQRHSIARMQMAQIPRSPILRHVGSSSAAGHAPWVLLAHGVPLPASLRTARPCRVDRCATHARSPGSAHGIRFDPTLRRLGPINRWRCVSTLAGPACRFPAASS